MNAGLDRLARDIETQIDDELQRSGILYRIFSRAKSEPSIQQKMLSKDYANSPEKKLMQDIIGVRITLYFEDDISIVHEAIKRKFNFVDETIDKVNISVFEPNRINLIFRMSKEHENQIVDLVTSKYQYIDSTFEVQLRTVLSEGWHEVEHDLRYKCKEDWKQHADLSHIFNGVYASLVTSDWSMISIFEDLAYRHYKSRSWAAMIRNKFRLRFIQSDLDEQVVLILDQDKSLSKEIYKLDRVKLLRKIFIDGIRIPITLTNLVFLINAYFLHNDKIQALAPEFITTNPKLKYTK